MRQQSQKSATQRAYDTWRHMWEYDYTAIFIRQQALKLKPV